ncbi:MAG TPA: SBBP repeat-containing protein [Verrucomicrobiae bacterium]|nr:SBBP repeat-containing protein [Verrucomicrobiae bacterium]
MSSQRLYAPAYLQQGLLIYAADASGNVAPINTISGPLTELLNPFDAALDSKGTIYVSNLGGTIEAYNSTATGNTVPVRSFGSGSVGVAIDRANNLYATRRYKGDEVVHEVDVYAPGSNTPVRSIVGKNTGLAFPTGVAVGADGKIYVANAGSGPCGTFGSITVYAAGASGNVSPIESIGGSQHSAIFYPEGIAVDPNGNVYVSTPDIAAILVFAPGANGDVAPIAQIQVPTPTSALNAGNAGLALDADGNIYVSSESVNDNQTTGQILVYPPLADLLPDRLTQPTRVINGSRTGLGSPTLIAIH